MFKVASKEDIDILLDIESTSYNEILSKENLLYELNENPVSTILIYYKDNIPMGYIDYWITFDSSTIFKITTKDIYRNKGIASSLIEEMIKDLKMQDVLYSTLEVRKDNLNAIKLYKKYNYNEITIKSHYYKDGSDAIYMVKGIN